MNTEQLITLSYWKISNLLEIIPLRKIILYSKWHTAILLHPNEIMKATEIFIINEIAYPT